MNARLRSFFAVFVFAILSLLVGCAKAEPPGRSMDAVGATPAAPPGAPNADRARIVTVNMSLRVDELDDAIEQVRRDVESAGGYVEGSSFAAGDDGSATMDLRVPADRASATRASLRAKGHVISESETVQDVTEQRADLGARLKAARTQETRLLEIMQNKTGSIADVLEAEKEIARVRESIEKLEAEQRTMEGKIDMATIHLTLTTPSSAAWQTPGRSVAGAWHAGVRGAQAIAVWSAMAVAALAPTLVPILAAVLLLVLLFRRARAKRTAALQAS